MLNLTREQHKAFLQLLEVLEDPINSLDDHAQNLNESFLDAIFLHVKEGAAVPHRVEKMQYTQRRMHAIINVLKEVKKSDQLMMS